MNIRSTLSQAVISLVLLLILSPAMAIEELVTTATRLDKPQNKVPMALGVVLQDDLQLGRQQIGLDEALVNVPGLFMLNRYNFAQDLRIAIRGFGARANFGIRGIRIFVDGIPAATPDGQGGVDSLDLASTERVEVIRGPSSSLYGAASGGVISLQTESGPATPFAEVRAAAGDYDFQRIQLKGGGQFGRLNALASLSYTTIAGFRGHADNQNTVFNSKFRYEFADSSDLMVTVGLVDSPLANDAGGLNANEVAADREQGRARNIAFDAGETLEQHRIGGVYRKSFRDLHEIRLRAYYVNRDFTNKLPFTGGGAVAFARDFVGGGAQYNYLGDLFGRPNRFVLGFDIDDQSDDRQRFDNNNGILGALVFDQIESVQSRGVYFQNEFGVLDNLELTVGGRYDEVEFDVEDAFLANGDDSGAIEFSEFSPMVGLLWTPFDGVNLYGNISTAFETPTTTEFANPAAGGSAGGFNAGLEPQLATNYELGVKGLVGDRVTYDVAVFTIDVSDELVAFELPGLSGRSFFMNAGESTRNGIEAAFQVALTDNLSSSFAYTFSDFEFERFRVTNAGGMTTVFDGNELPGIPDNQLHLAINYRHPRGFYASFDLLVVDSFFADNANTVEIDSYQVGDFRIGHEFALGGVQISPFLGINNLFDEDYLNNVRLNATFGRYFEPAPDRNVYGGVTLRHSFGP